MSSVVNYLKDIRRNFSLYFFLFISYLLLVTSNLLARTSYQNTTDTTDLKVYRVAVFAPLYLDSVFTTNKLRNERILPKFIMPAVEFVQGAQIAFDTLQLNNEHLEVFIYDTKSFTEPLTQLIKNKKRTHQSHRLNMFFHGLNGFEQMVFDCIGRNA